MKASEAIQKGIDIDFTVNDLSTLPFETSDMIVLLSNLLDNAIEANQVYCGDKKIHVIALWEKVFCFPFGIPQIRSKSKTIPFTQPSRIRNFMASAFLT